MPNEPRDTPKVFVSYTARDLLAHAEQALIAIRKKGWLPVHFRDWSETGGHKVETCLQHVGRCQVVIVLVAHRYGWVPDKEDGIEGERVRADGWRSMVWLEVTEALRTKKLVMPFCVEPSHAWNPELIEGIRDGSARERLEEFRRFLDRHLVTKFTTPDSVREAVKDALDEAEKRLFDPVRRYQDAVREKCGRVALVGFGHDLDVELPIEEIYVPIRLSPQHEAARLEALQREEWTPSDGVGPRAIALEQIARETKARGFAATALLGVPGCGKSTALRRLAWACGKPEGGAASLGLDPNAVPVLLRLRTLRAHTLPGDWWSFVQGELEGWLALGLSSWDWLEQRPVLWLLDGLDEIADEDFRGKVLNWTAQSLGARLRNGRDRLVVTSRDGGWPEGGAEDGRKSLPFLELRVDLLDPDQRLDFVHRWYGQVKKSLEGDHPNVMDQAHERAQALCKLLDERDFRSLRLAQVVANPLLLSILCLVHLDQTNLPRRRAALYDKCLSVLLTHWRKEWRKQQGLERLDEVGAREVLKALAWWLHSERESPAAPGEEWERRAGDSLPSLSEAARLGRDGAALVRRLQDESGVLVEVSAGQKSFLHSTFQEYLAARHAVEEGLAADLAGRFGDERWKEVVLLALSGAPHAFARTFFTALFERAAWRASRDLLALAIEESLHVPIEPFVQAIEDADSDGRRALLHLVRKRSDAPLLDLVSRLSVEDDDPGVQGLAREVLQGAGRPVPMVARLGPDVGRVHSPIPEAWLELAGPKLGDVRVVQPAGIALVYVPSGKFDMGSEKGTAAERPVRRVRVKGFWLAKHPVTNSEYARFLEATGAAQPGFWTNSLYNQPNQPVVGVSWGEAKKYCEWAKLELPSEAQWEYACRGATRPTKTEYWFGDDEKELEDVAWFAANSGGRLQAVAQKRPNPFGLFDVHGNVWEWCEDTWHGNYKGAPTDARAWVDKASGLRVIRGGSFIHTAGVARSASRSGSRPSIRWLVVGFRPAQAVTT